MTSNLEVAPIEAQTLAERLSKGRIPVQEALRYASLLGEAIQKLHSDGKAHGAIAPESIILTGAAIDVTPPKEELGDQVTGVPADIYGFGAVLYEMLTGCRALSGEEPSVLETTGMAEADRLIAVCLAGDPVARPMSIQKVLLELKFLGLAARRDAAPAATRREAMDAALRAEMQRIEDRVTAHFEKHEKSVAEKTMRASDQWNAVTAELTASEERIGEIEVKLAEHIHRLETSNEAQAISMESVRTSLAQTDNMVGRVLETMGAVQESIKKLEAGDSLKDLTAELAALKAGVAAVQQGVEANAARFTTLERSTEKVEAQLAEKIQTIKKENDIQAASIESLRASAAQTDDLVGRVVEAMETIQDSVLDQVGG